MEWYYARGDIKRGPVSEEELRYLVKDGIVSPDTRVWTEGMEDWSPLSELPEMEYLFLGKPKPEEGREVSGSSEKEAGSGEEYAVAEGKGESSRNEIRDRKPDSHISADELLGNRVMPPDYNGQAIFGLVVGAICCMPVLIPAIFATVYSSKVRLLYSRGDYEGSIEASLKAKTWSSITVWMMVIAVLLLLVYFAVALNSSVSYG